MVYFQCLRPFERIIFGGVFISVMGSIVANSFAATTQIDRCKNNTIDIIAGVFTVSVSAFVFLAILDYIYDVETVKFGLSLIGLIVLFVTFATIGVIQIVYASIKTKQCEKSVARRGIEITNLVVSGFVFLLVFLFWIVCSFLATKHGRHVSSSRDFDDRHRGRYR